MTWPTRHIDALRAAGFTVRTLSPLMPPVVLPDHLHCLWTLPPGDEAFSMRWRVIKTLFARSLTMSERRSDVRRRNGERGIWQRRLWEHSIRDDEDFSAHVDDVHFNPVKHGCVAHVVDWPHATFKACVRRGLYPQDWLGPVERTLSAEEVGE